MGKRPWRSKAKGAAASIAKNNAAGADAAADADAAAAVKSRDNDLGGGGVNAENADALFACPHVDGALVGGASLEAASFMAIAQSASNNLSH